MYKSLQSSITEWSESTSERQKLQHVYLMLVVVLLVVAGLAGLVNYSLSQQILGLAFLAAIVFLANLVIWALLQSIVLLPIEKRAQTTKEPAVRISSAAKKPKK